MRTHTMLSPERTAHAAAQCVVLGLFPSEPCTAGGSHAECSSSDTSPAAESPGRSAQGAVLHALNAMQPTCAGSTAALRGASTALRRASVREVPAVIAAW